MDIQNLATESAQAQKAAALKKDLLLSAIIGLILALFLLPILKQSEIKIPLLYACGLAVVLPVLSALGMFIALFIARKIKVIYQLAKFVLVGALNTFVDWGVLNILMLLFVVTSGPLFSVFKGASFAVAVINSYFWNKFWTFKKAPVDGVDVPVEQKNVSKEVLQFFLVSLVGLGLNVGIASIIVNVVEIGRAHV